MSVISETYSQDLIARIGDRRLNQFRGGPVRCAILNEQSRQMQEAFDAIVHVLETRTLLSASGVVLDVIGRVVGQTREVGEEDVAYRQSVASKIFKNHVKYGSIPEVLAFIRFLYSFDISLRKMGLSRLQLIIPGETPASTVARIRATLSDDRADNQHFLPHCPTVDIVQVVFRPTHPFAPDRASGAPDIGRAAVSTD